MGSPGRTQAKSFLEVVWGKVVPGGRWKEQNEQNRRADKLYVIKLATATNNRGSI